MSVDLRAASAKGVAIRQERAKLKRGLASGDVDFLDTFDRGVARVDPVVAGLRVEPFLRCIPAIGTTKAGLVLERLGISPRATIGGLRVNQRRAFREELVELTKTRRAKQRRGVVVVIAGPTAVGKATVIKAVKALRPEYEVSISATTRPRRPGEKHGRDYFFVDQAEFDRMIAANELLEWATVHGTQRYGTPKGPVLAHQERGGTVLLEIDIQGAEQVRESGFDALYVFLAPPSFNALVERLQARGTEDDDERRRRLATAVEELGRKDEFDAVVINDVVEKAAQEVVDLISRFEHTQGER